MIPTRIVISQALHLNLLSSKKKGLPFSSWAKRFHVCQDFRFPGYENDRKMCVKSGDYNRKLQEKHPCAKFRALIFLRQ